MIQLLEHRAISLLATWLALILVTGGSEYTRALRNYATSTALLAKPNSSSGRLLLPLFQKSP